MHEEQQRAIEVRPELHPVCLNLADSSQAEDLKPAAVGQNRPIPPHEAVQSADFRDEFRPWPQREVIGIREQLLHTDLPIGLLWKQERLETYREIIEKAVIRCPHLAHHFELPEDAWFVSRTYLIYHGGRPLGAITEQWPTSWFADREIGCLGLPAASCAALP